MPLPAEKPVPPAELNDRTEGWGTFGNVKNNPIKDDGVWPAEVMHNREFNHEPSETSDGSWYRSGGLIGEAFGYDGGYDGEY